MQILIFLVFFLEAKSVNPGVGVSSVCLGVRKNSIFKIMDYAWLSSSVLMIFLYLIL